VVRFKNLRFLLSPPACQRRYERTASNPPVPEDGCHRHRRTVVKMPTAALAAARDRELDLPSSAEALPAVFRKRRHRPADALGKVRPRRDTTKNQRDKHPKSPSTFDPPLRAGRMHITIRPDCPTSTRGRHRSCKNRKKEKQKTASAFSFALRRRCRSRSGHTASVVCAARRSVR